MTLSRFRVAPRKGHLEMLGIIFGYLRKFPDGALIVDGHVGRSHDKVVEGQRVCIKGWRPLLAPAPAK